MRKEKLIDDLTDQSKVSKGIKSSTNALIYSENSEEDGRIKNEWLHVDIEKWIKQEDMIWKMAEKHSRGLENYSSFLCVWCQFTRAEKYNFYFTNPKSLSWKWRNFWRIPHNIW